MKYIVMIIAIFLTMPASAKIDLETQIALFESSCIEYYEGVIDRKMGDDKSPEKRKKWEDTLFKDYRFAKNPNNPTEERLKAIKQANLMCDVQRKLGI